MTDHHSKTRRVYHEQHQRVAADPVAMERFIGMFTADYFGLGNNWFTDKIALDAGCGSTGKLIINSRQTSKLMPRTKYFKPE